MSAGRWRVYFLPLSRMWVVRDQNDELCGHFRTLPEAHTHAMKLARTVEEELPKVRHLLQGTHYRVVSSRDWTDFHWEESDDFVSIPSHDRHRIAMHLLALHYHHERNQK